MAQDKFQSLIGRLRTANVAQHIDIDNEFQSLIGRLRTICLMCRQEGRLIVSIPHR